MASCPKCGKTKLKRRKGILNCNRCGILSIKEYTHESEKVYHYFNPDNEHPRKSETGTPSGSARCLPVGRAGSGTMFGENSPNRAEKCI